MRWHQQRVEDICRELKTSLAGLSTAEAADRLEKVGTNELRGKKKRSALLMLLGQFRDFLIMVLLAAALLAGVVGHPHDALPIVVIVIINALIGFLQEYRAATAMDLLRRMSAQTATVLRDGHPETIQGSTLVPGDVVLLAAGDIVPADLRLTATAELMAEESALTGESMPAAKQSSPLPEDDLPLADRSNMAYKRTIITSGRGTGIVVATGMSTELGKIAALIDEGGEGPTPLQRRLAIFGRNLAIVIMLICAVLFVSGYLRGEPPLLMLLTAISLAVAAIPEALPAVITVSLALGASKLARHNALIRRLPAVETLGSVTHICTDKTGTLTRNVMTVTEIWPEKLLQPGDSIEREQFFTVLALCNDVRRDSEGGLGGDPTETALYRKAEEEGFDPVRLAADLPRLAELPFDSGRKRMSTFHRRGGESFIFTKGGIDEVLVVSVKGEKFSAEMIRREAERLAAQGLRVLAVAMGRLDTLPDSPTVANEAGLTVLGLAGIMDPPREEAAAAVEESRGAGIVPIMITGDHPATAAHIAGRLSILNGNGEIIDGRELAALSQEELAERTKQVRVYARVAPEQKLNIVKALQDKGHVVAMTGDGVNDAPALKAADIGVAMGITGTDVAREASALVLLDDNFATIVTAVREGRRIYANIMKFILYSITANAGTLWAIFLAPFFGLPLPLMPIQILWLNLLCDSLPGLALTAEPAAEEIMKRPPVNPGEGVFSGNRGWFALGYGLNIGIVALLLQHFAAAAGSPWQTMVFTFLVVNRMAVVLIVRSPRRSLATLGLSGNPHLVAAILITLMLQLAVVYLPFCHPVFNTVPLSAGELAVTCTLALVMVGISEVQKLLTRRKTARK